MKTLNQQINAKLKRGRREIQPLKPIQVEAIIYLYTTEHNNSVTEIAKKVGVSWWKADFVISEYLKNPEPSKNMFFESKINK